MVALSRRRGDGPAPRQRRRRAWSLPLGIILLLSLALLAAACSATARKDAAATTTATPTPTPKQALTAAAARVQNQSAFHFLLTHENGSTPIALGLSMTKADGDFEKPDRLRATINATALSLPVTVKAIAIGSQTWITNPISGGDQYQLLPNGTTATAILDPNNGILKAARDMNNPTYGGTEHIGTVDTQLVQGTVDAGNLQSLDADAQAGKTVTVKAWIGRSDGLIYRVRLEGPLTNSEPKNIARQIDLSQFGESVDIQPPS